MKKLLFIVISMPEYRISFFKGVAAKINTDFCCLDIEGAVKTYGIDTKEQLKDLSVIVPQNMDDVVNILSGGNYTHVVIPSVDTTSLYKLDRLLLGVAKAKHIRTVYWSENWIAPISTMSMKKRIRTFVRKELIGNISRQCNVCIAAGTKAARFFAMIGVGENRIKTAYDSSTNPNSASVNIRKRHSIEVEETIILYLGRLIERKGLHLLIEAVSNMQEYNKPLILVGGEYNEYAERCKQRAETLGVKIIFAGLVSPNERASYFEQSDVFVLPSYFLDGQIEAWGLTINECLETGTPVVATTAVGAAYDLLDGKSGLMVKENDIGELQKGISACLNIHDARDNCRNTAKSFSVEQMVNSFFAALP